MAAGPLIPGLQEFDRPRRGWPRWLTGLVVALVVAVIAMVLAGFAGGVGPLGVLGRSTTQLEPVSYRTTQQPEVIQLAVTLPPSGLCRDDTIDTVAFERGNRVEVEASVTRSRRASCTVTTIGGDVRWVDLRLAQPLGERQVIRLSDREPLPVEAP